MDQKCYVALVGSTLRVGFLICFLATFSESIPALASAKAVDPCAAAIAGPMPVTDPVVKALRRIYPPIPLEGSPEFNEAFEKLDVQESIVYPFGDPSTRELTGRFYKPTSYVEPDLREELERRGFKEPINLWLAELWARFYGVRALPAVKKLPAREYFAILRNVLHEISKLPLPYIRLAESTGKNLDVVLNNVTTHPRLVDLKGKRPRGWERGTWDEAPGAGSEGLDTPMVVAGDSLYKGHGSVNVILHEYFHGIDYAFSEVTKGPKLSDLSRFKHMHSLVTSWDKYEQEYPEEAFAETLAKFYHSAESRAKLREENRYAYRYASWVDAAITWKDIYNE